MTKLNNFVEKNFKKLTFVGTAFIFLLMLILMTVVKVDVVEATNSLRDKIILNGNVKIANAGEATTDELLAKGFNVGYDQDMLDELIQAIIDNNNEELNAKYLELLGQLEGEYNIEALKEQLRNIGDNVLQEHINELEAEFEKAEANANS